MVYFQKFDILHQLKALYYSLFKSHLIYGCQVWGQYQGTEYKKIETLQEKAIRIMKFLPNNAPVSKEMHKLRTLLHCKTYFLYMTTLKKKEWKALTQPLNKWKLINFTIQDPLIHTNWKDKILKQENMATSLYWANVYQTGTYSKML